MRNNELAKEEMMKIAKELLIKKNALFKSDVRGKRLKFEKMWADMEEEFEKMRKKYNTDLVLVARDFVILNKEIEKNE